MVQKDTPAHGTVSQVGNDESLEGAILCLEVTS